MCRGAEYVELLERLGTFDATIWHVSPGVFEKLAFGQRAEGVVAVAETPVRTLEHLPANLDGVIAVLCGLEKPGNVGAILHSADGNRGATQHRALAAVPSGGRAASVASATGAPGTAEMPRQDPAASQTLLAPKLAAFGKIAMAITMGYMLIIML